MGRAQAGSAFTSLVNISLVATVRLHKQAGRGELHLVMLVLSLAAFVFQLVVGILLVISPGNHVQVYSVAYLEIALFAVALGRAWGLVQGKHLRPPSARNEQKPANYLQPEKMIT